MEILQELGWALGFATLAGLNLYLVVLVAGVAIRFDWIDLLSQYEQLAVVILAVILVTKFRRLLVAAFRRLRPGKSEEKSPA